MPPKEVTEYLEKESGRLFDPYIVGKFLPLITTK
jgi:response regulator RpfG family c-di-GMP phosphodiesterase